MQEPAPGASALDDGQRAAADAGLKALVPLAAADGGARPFLDFVLAALADAGFGIVVLVVAPDADAMRERYSGANAPARIRLDWAIQREPLGTADAVRAAELVVAGRPFVVVNADNLYPVEGLRALRELDGPGLLVFTRDGLAGSSGMTMERLAAFAMPVVSADGLLTDIVEKPGSERLGAAGGHALVSMNAWRFDARIFDACRDVGRSPRGEFELPDAVRLALARGVRFQAIPARGPVIDLTRREDIAGVAAALARRDVRL
jgi:glucose-1-phosphate thymidylyltransferase